MRPSLMLEKPMTVLLRVLILAFLATPLMAEEDPVDPMCRLATKTYSIGAVIVDDGVALRCQDGGAWELAAQVVHCLSQGKAYSAGGRITAPGPEGPLVQVCRKGQWEDEALLPAEEAKLVN
ncbi:MAG: DUF1496 domain-containing protein [Pseudomonadota bacterium]